MAKMRESGWDAGTLAVVWSKGRVIPGYDPNVWMLDRFGNVIKWDEYGMTSKYGWEVDHIRPSSRGGGDDFTNLQPLHWQSNRKKSDSLP